MVVYCCVLSEQLCVDDEKCLNEKQNAERGFVYLSGMKWTKEYAHNCHKQEFLKYCKNVRKMAEILVISLSGKR